MSEDEPRPRQYYIVITETKLRMEHMVIAHSVDEAREKFEAQTKEVRENDIGSEILEDKLVSIQGTFDVSEGVWTP